MTEFKIGDRVKTRDGGPKYSGVVVSLRNFGMIDILRDDKEQGTGIKVNGVPTWHTSKYGLLLDRIENWRKRIK